MIDRRGLLGRSGYSIAEIMIALGIASIVILGVSHLIVTFNQEAKSISETLDFDEEAFRLEYFFNLPLRTAVNVKAAAGSIDNYAIPPTGTTAYEGRLRSDFDSGDPAIPGANNNATVNAFFLAARDTSIMTPGGAISQFKGVGIYFQQPSATTFGVLYIYTQGGNLKPLVGGNFSTNLTRVAVENIVTSGAYVSSFTVHVWMRYPVNPSQAVLNWCPTSNPCGGGGALAKDFERSFVVNLMNNFDPADPSQKLQLGRIYFLGRGTM